MPIVAMKHAWQLTTRKCTTAIHTSVANCNIVHGFAAAVSTFCVCVRIFIVRRSSTHLIFWQFTVVWFLSQLFVSTIFAIIWTVSCSDKTRGFGRIYYVTAYRIWKTLVNQSENVRANTSGSERVNWSGRFMWTIRVCQSFGNGRHNGVYSTESRKKVRVRITMHAIIRRIEYHV